MCKQNTSLVLLVIGLIVRSARLDEISKTPNKLFDNLECPIEVYLNEINLSEGVTQDLFVEVIATQCDVPGKYSLKGIYLIIVEVDPSNFEKVLLSDIIELDQFASQFILVVELGNTEGAVRCVAFPCVRHIDSRSQI